MKTCPNCGFLAEDNDKRCRRCDEDISTIESIKFEFKRDVPKKTDAQVDSETYKKIYQHNFNNQENKKHYNPEDVVKKVFYQEYILLAIGIFYFLTSGIMKINNYKIFLDSYYNFIPPILALTLIAISLIPFFKQHPKIKVLITSFITFILIFLFFINFSIETVLFFKTFIFIPLILHSTIYLILLPLLIFFIFTLFLMEGGNIRTLMISLIILLITLVIYIYPPDLSWKKTLISQIISTFDNGITPNSAFLLLPLILSLTTFLSINSFNVRALIFAELLIFIGYNFWFFIVSLDYGIWDRIVYIKELISILLTIFILSYSLLIIFDTLSVGKKIKSVLKES